MRLAVVSGEPSGQSLARRFIDHLGVDPVFEGHELPNAVGLFQGMRVAPAAVRAVRALGEAIEAVRPDVVLTIDNPGLNLRLAGRLSVPVVHWVSPQLWAWRPGRAQRVARPLAGLACLFPFEGALYRGTGLRTVVTGHPASTLPISERPEALGVAAGSRPAERRRNGPVMRTVADAIGLPVVEAVPPGASPTIPGARAVSDVGALSSEVRVALCCSGTATLELACAGVPHVVVYATDPVSARLARRVLRTPWMALPNILLGREVLPEHLGLVCADAVRRDVERLFVAERDDLVEVRQLVRWEPEQLERLLCGVAGAETTR